MWVVSQAVVIVGGEGWESHHSCSLRTKLKLKHRVVD